MASDEFKFEEWLQSQVEKGGKNIESSDMFMALYTENYKTGPQCALELGIATLLDKPIYILAPEGAVISENMFRLARGFEFFNPDEEGSVEEAAKRLTKKAVDELTMKN